MGREVRRVPADWEHPKDANGYYIPMYERIQYTPSEIKEGILEGWIKDGIPTMPQWPESERTHWQMYETCTEGTLLLVDGLYLSLFLGGYFWVKLYAGIRQVLSTAFIVADKPAGWVIFACLFILSRY